MTVGLPTVKQAHSAPTDAAVTALRWPLPSTISPTEALARLRGRRRLVGLLGSWAGGGAIIACDPVARAARLSDIISPTVEGAPEVMGVGWFGVLGYQYGARLEVLPPAPVRPCPTPECDFAYYDHLLRYETSTGTWWFESAASPGRAKHIERAYQRFRRIMGAGENPQARPYTCGTFTMRPGPNGHRRAVAKALDAIRAGDIFQTNLTARLQADFDGDPLDVFVCGVEHLQPAYAAYLSTETGAVASFSPELFLQRTGKTVRTSPIKGTAPLRADPDELLASVKDNAENTMIVDLMRNDLGRVSIPGSVTVPRRTRVEEHTGVWHLLTDVVSTLHDEVTDTDLLGATFPPGSVTGAPKVRAMELINELEETAREAYTGAIGVMSSARMEFNVAIRTFEFTDDTVWLGVGGGIVADSTPDGELVECLAKAEPLLHAIGATLADTADVPDTAPQRRDARVVELTEVLPELAGRLPLVVVDDSGIRLDAHNAHGPALPALDKIVASLRRCHLRIDETKLTVDDLRGGTEAFVVEPDGTPVAVGTACGRRIVHPGPLTRWLAAQIIGRGNDTHEDPRPETPLRYPRIPDAALDLRVLLIDNYDSFVFNLSQFCEELGARTEVIRNDPDHLPEILAAVADARFQRIIVSPGPGAPGDAGMSVPLIRALAGVVPILGVCLGHQAIGEAFGARTVRAPRPVHGQPTLVHHDSAGIYADLTGPFTAARYHSLVIDEDTLPAELAATARTPSGLLMGVRHREFDVEGIQVHPESLLTPAGHHLLRTFLHSTAISIRPESAPPWR
jgi:anthranilate synthase/aminodeoxychorismate synthase-like glutamine amidotransferase